MVQAYSVMTDQYKAGADDGPLTWTEMVGFTASTALVEAAKANVDSLMTLIPDGTESFDPVSPDFSDIKPGTAAKLRRELTRFKTELDSYKV